jgi:hypothetical protein
MFNLFRQRQPEATREPPDSLAHPVIRVPPAHVPPVVVIHRHEPIHDRDADPQTFHQYNVAENVQLAPQPVAYTQWWNVGRDPAHAWPRMNLYQFLSPRDWLSVAQWPFSSVGHTPAGSLVTQPQGRFMPQVGRANITPGAQTSLGAQTGVRPPITFDVNHAKLLF